MKKAIILLSIIITIIFSCTSEKKQKLFNKDNIRTQLFSINPQKENLIKGVRGGEFKIPKGAFEGNEPVTIELKEIYAPIEILASGLTTESNGELLESGGMFYINAKRNGEQLDLLKPIDGSIPTEYINDSMKLFKGEEIKDGNVNWVEPEELKNDTSKDEECYNAGRILFQAYCASCHHPYRKLTGPALFGTEKQITKEMYYEFVKDPVKAARKYSYFSHLIAEYEGILMTAFPSLSEKEVDCIIEYLKKPTVPVAGKDSSNPCGYDTTYIDTSFNLIVENAFSRFNTSSADTTFLNSDTLTPSFDTLVSLPKERYEFKINTLGWYNIDVLLKGLEGVTDVDISATTTFENKKSIDVRIYMPEKKISLDGEYDIEAQTFYFGSTKGKIPMYIGDKAIVFAIAESEGKLLYFVQELSVQPLVKIILNFKQTTQTELDEAFRKINLDNINLDRQTKKPIIIEKPCDGKAVTAMK
jgi:Cytochrome c